MLATTAIAILTALFVKHFIADFLYQPPFQWKNKGTYGHIGGIFHSGQHALASAAILWWFGVDPAWILPLCLGEFSIHYHTDWLKMNVNKWKGWTATTHNEFWISLGVDQLVHSLTYIGMVYVLTFL